MHTHYTALNAAHLLRSFGVRSLSTLRPSLLATTSAAPRRLRLSASVSVPASLSLPATRPTRTIMSTSASASASAAAASSGETVLDLILSDHQLMRTQFQAYHSATNKDDKQRLAWELIRTISRHGACEEMSIYPWMKDRSSSFDHVVNHSIEEHQTLKEDLAKLDKLTVEDPQFDATIQKAWKDLAHHLEEEEENLLPELRKAASEQELRQLADKFKKVENIAPTRPHPHAPAEGAAAVAANMGAKVVDSVRDAARFGVKEASLDSQKERERNMLAQGDKEP